MSDSNASGVQGPLPPATITAAVFDTVFASDQLIEGFTPLSESMLWKLNAQYWSDAGAAAFTRDAVPFHVTNDGALSVAAADLIARHATSLKERGRAHVRINVVELGPGSGLFARLLFQRYEALRAENLALPELGYLGVESSRKMIDDIVHRAILKAPQVDFLCLDLAEEINGLEERVLARVGAEHPVVVICNYVLDSLPASHLRRVGTQVVQTEVELRSAGNRTEELAGSSGPMIVHPNDMSASIVVRSRERPANLKDPLAALAARFLDYDGAAAPLNVGAIRCLAALVRLTNPDGLTLINDYAAGFLEDNGQIYQSFAGSIATGLHFPMIDAFVQDHLGAVCVAPRAPVPMIVSRLILPHSDRQTETAFQDLFSLGSARRTQAHLAAARSAQNAGHLRQAAASYERAVAEQPDNWSVLTEAAGFLAVRAGQNDAGEALAKLALASNPICAPAYNVLGDCRYRRGDVARARDAYEDAVAVDRSNARALLNLVYCDCAAKDFSAALSHIARALEADANGALTQEILERQREIVGRLGTLHGRS